MGDGGIESPPPHALPSFCASGRCKKTDRPDAVACGMLVGIPKQPSKGNDSVLHAIIYGCGYRAVSHSPFVAQYAGLRGEDFYFSIVRCVADADHRFNVNQRAVRRRRGLSA